MINKFESTFSYESGKMYLKSSEKPLAVDIMYKGLIKGVSSLPNGFFILEGNNRILIINFNNKDMPEEILSYLGYFDALKVKVYSKEGVSYSTIDKNSTIWNKMNNARGYAKMTSNWEEYDHFGFSIGNDPASSVQYSNLRASGSYIINNNLSSDTGDFKLKGKKYEGKITYDSRGIFMNDKQEILIPRKKTKLLNLIMNKGRK